jgi:fructose 1,6-bisphosphate aldolase/phosphatase
MLLLDSCSHQIEEIKMNSITMSIIKADVGSVGGHTRPSLAMLAACKARLNKAIHDRVLIDGMVTFTGDDIGLFMSHFFGVDSTTVHGVARECFLAATEVAKQEGDYAAGQDLLTDAPSGNLKGAGPGVAEMTFDLLPNHRTAEAFLVFMADKCGPGAFNLPLYLLLCDPMHNGGLLLSPVLHKGFTVTVMDMEAVKSDRIIRLTVPEESWDLAALLRNTDRYAIEAVHSRAFPDEQLSAASVTRLHNIAGKYIGKDDPTLIVRVQNIFPAPEEVVEPWAVIHQIVTGGCRGSHNMPIMPVAAETAVTGPYCLPLVSALAFSMAIDGRFTHNMVDMFANPSWDWVRLAVQKQAAEFRRQGFFGIAMASKDELAYTGFTDILAGLDKRFTAC